MLLFEFPDVNLGYTNAVFTKLNNKLKRCRFASAMAHIAVDLVPEVCEPMLNDKILEAVENDILQRPPLQKNTAYFFCTIKTANEESDIFKLLAKPNIDYKSVQLRLDSLSLYEKDYFKEEFTVPITKDIIMISDNTGDQVGWYNIQANILWMSDLGHNRDTAAKQIASLLDRIHEYQTEGTIKVLPELTIGADPEFEILASKISSPEEGQGKQISAQSIFQNGINSEVGHNGNPETGELRPHHADHPLRLARNIKRTVKKLVRNPVIEDYALYAGGGWTKQLGGHIHFNIRSMPDKLKYALYDLVGRYVKDGMDRSKRKESISYMSRDGGEVLRPTETHPGVEWRFLPSFIINDDINKAILCTTWALVKAYYANEIPETNDTMSNEQVISILKSISLYETYKIHIDKFTELFIAKKTSMEGIDLRDSWNMKSIPRQTNVRIYSNIGWVNRSFTPVNVDIPHKINIDIELNQNDNELLTTGTHISKDILKIVEEFADAHFVVHRHINKADESGKNCSIGIFLPYAWRSIKNTNLAFDIMKNLIQKVIVTLSDKQSEEEEVT